MTKAQEIRPVLAAFTEDQAQRLTGISASQLRYWDRTGFFNPSLAASDRSLPNSRLYSFRDLVSLRVLNALRNESKVPLPHLREVKDALAHLGEALWGKTTLYVLNRKVVIKNPETEAREEVVSHQGVLGIPLEVVTGEMQSAVDKLRERGSDVVGKIDRHRNIAHNQPVIAGTRIPVRTIQAFADEGYTAEQILAEYPTLTTEDVLAAIQHRAA